MIILKMRFYTKHADGLINAVWLQLSPGVILNANQATLVIEGDSHEELLANLKRALQRLTVIPYGFLSRHQRAASILNELLEENEESLVEELSDALKKLLSKELDAVNIDRVDDHGIGGIFGILENPILREDIS